MKGYPRWFLPALLGAMLLMFVTGVLLAPTTLMLKAELALPWHLPSSARVLTAALHAAGGFTLMLLVGALWSLHMRAGWRRNRQRGSGAVLGVMLLVLAVSAVAVYYLGDETLGATAALIHLGTGLALALPFGWHWVHGHRARRHNLPHPHAAAPHQYPRQQLKAIGAD